MEKRTQINEIDPLAYKGMIALQNYVSSSDLIDAHKHLITLKASQINKCSFCFDMHTTEAKKSGFSKQKIFSLSTWENTDLFTDEEQIILKMTQEVTLISENGLSTSTYDEAISTFGEKYFAQVIMAIITINSWNRIAISTCMPIPE